MVQSVLSVAMCVAVAACATIMPVRDYEVWAADQNGNLIYVLGPDGEVRRSIDSAALGNGRRPHILSSVPGNQLVFSANTVSNSVTVLTRDGAVVTVIPAVGKGPHAVQPHPTRPDRVYVMNIGPQAAPGGTPDRGETIAEITRAADGQWRVARHLDLKAAPALAEGSRFASRRPVTAGFTKDGRTMLVTLFDGGMAMIDLDSWRVVNAWDRTAIARHAVVVTPSPDGNELYVTAGDAHSSWLYVIDVAGTEPRLVASHNLSAVGQDAHGVDVDVRRGNVWVVHRVSSNVTVHPVSTIRNADHRYWTIPFVGKAPDLVTFSPDYSRAYVTLRGPRPAPTIPHAMVGETPGVSLVDPQTRTLLRVIRIGDQEAGDFHGIFVPQR